MFAREHPEAFRTWHDESQFVVVLSVPDISELTARFSCLPDYAHRAIFREADLGGDPTAFAVLGADAGRLLSDLPLALREVAMT